MVRKSRNKKQKSRRSSRQRNSRRRRRVKQYNAGGDSRLRVPIRVEDMITIRDYFPDLEPRLRKTVIVDRYTWRKKGVWNALLPEDIYTAPSYFPISRLRSILPDYRVEWIGVPNPEEYFVDNPFRERLPHQMSHEEKAEVIRQYSPREAFDKYRDRQYKASQYWLDRAFDRTKFHSRRCKNKGRKACKKDPVCKFLYDSEHPRGGECVSRSKIQLPDELNKKIIDIAKHLPADLVQTFSDQWLPRKYRGYQGGGIIIYPPLIYRRYGRPPIGSGINL